MPNHDQDDEHVIKCYDHQTSRTIQNANYPRKTQKKLFLVKDKREAWYKAECLNRMNFFFETDSDSTAWDELAKKCGASLDAGLLKNL